MKTKNNFESGRKVQFFQSRNLTRLIFGALILMFFQTSVFAQEPVAKAPQFTPPTWWFGVAAGANFNFYQGTTQELNSDFIVPAAFHHGSGVGLYAAPLVEYRFPDSKFGVMLQAGYDGRNGKFESVTTPCNCVANLTTNLHYLTIEPSLRFAPFNSRFYLFGGPRLAFNVAKSFTYSQKANVDFPGQVPPVDMKSDFSNVNNVLLSMQIGAGYDIPLTSENQYNQMILSPFISVQPYWGQDPRSIETWTVTTVRVGAALKFGRGHLIANSPTPISAAVLDPEVNFFINSPENIVAERRVRETFPLRNYVFFDLGSTQIPDRYVLLNKDQVKDFKEDQLEVFTPKKLSGRSGREMVVYYNVLNILGDRMGKNPSTTVRLTGASMQGNKDGLAMAESVKNYLVDVFGIKPTRINTEGRVKPRISSEQPGATKELDLLREGDRRVSIWSESPELMMEFQSGPDAPLKAVQFTTLQTAPVDSYVTFNVIGAKDAFTSWALKIKDSEGNIQDLGPYSAEKVSIPGKTILGAKPEGNYTATMIGQTKSGKVVQKEVPIHIVLWKPAENEEGMRYSVIFEFNESNVINAYKKYLVDVVAPQISNGATVIVHGHTDIIGDEAGNMELSMARSNEVKTILENALSSANKKDVKFEVHAFGEDQIAAPFENNFPEERFYNRTVIIDIIPHK